MRAATDPRAHARSSVQPTRATFVAAIVALALALAARAHADPIEATVRARLAPVLPAELGVAHVYLPPALAALDADPSRVAIELPRELRAGRASLKLTVRGRRSVWVPVAISALAEVAIAQRALAPGDVIGAADIAVERRAAGEPTAAVATVVGATVTSEIAAGDAIGARAISRPPPLLRGTPVAIDVRRGAVHVRGTGTLEASARPGEPASARLTATRLVVHGRLVAPATLLVGDAP
ncbi:MAG TPA: flagellar basal body P-ring formation chaperone FlgA [Kofleriaceae bacterium]|nr:flagellar basal body P-ring formation chaperone FlgA [Kofleriaceae bacterium]